MKKIVRNDKMQEESDINIVDEGNDSIEGYDSGHDYIDVDDIPKQQRKDKLKKFGGMLSAGAKSVGSAIGTGASNVNKFLKDQGAKYKANAPQREAKKQQRLEKFKAWQERVKERGPPPQMPGNNMGGISFMSVGNNKPRTSKMPSIGADPFRLINRQKEYVNIPRIDAMRIDPWKMPGTIQKGTTKKYRRKIKSKAKKYVVVNGKKYWRR